MTSAVMAVFSDFIRNFYFLTSHGFSYALREACFPPCPRYNKGVGIVRKLAALVALLAAAVLLFVVVCPITPTPTAVITSRNTAPVNTVSVVLETALPALALLSFSAVRFESTTDAGEVAPRLSVRLRTCVQLC
jgi:hypothetical protein